MAGLVRLTHRSNLELFAEDLTRKAGSGPRTALHSSRSEHKTLPGGARAALRSDRNAVDLHGMHLRAQRCRSAISVLRPLYRGAAEAARACTGSTRRGAGRCETAGLGEAARKPEPAAAGPRAGRAAAAARGATCAATGGTDAAGRRRGRKKEAARVALLAEKAAGAGAGAAATQGAADGRRVAHPVPADRRAAVFDGTGRRRPRPRDARARRGAGAVGRPAPRLRGGTDLQAGTGARGEGSL